MDDRNDINKFRKKIKRRSLHLRLGVLLLVGLTAILIAVNWSREVVTTAQRSPLPMLPNTMVSSRRFEYTSAAREKNLNPLPFLSYIITLLRMARLFLTAKAGRLPRAVALRNPCTAYPKQMD